MFNRDGFIHELSLLGKVLKEYSYMDGAIAATHADNRMFTPFMQKRALRAIAENYLTEEALKKLLSYSDGSEDDINALRREMKGKKVGIITAGNIPAVGFHDILCTLSTGAKAIVKLSSKDRFLIPQMLNCEFISSWEDAPKLDFLLFSGSNRTKALVLNEFEGVPILARGSRFSLGVLSGEETDEDLRLLAEDMFLYGGLGCRSISLLFLPEGFDIQRIIKASSFMRERLMEMGPYKSNYIRRSALAKIENMFEHGNFTDGGFFILEEARKSFPPMAVVRYSFYKDISEVDGFCFRNRNSIQKKFTNFGMAQSPAIDDWMDGVNTVWSILEGCGVLRKSNG